MLTISDLLKLWTTFSRFGQILYKPFSSDSSVKYDQIKASRLRWTLASIGRSSQLLRTWWWEVFTSTCSGQRKTDKRKTLGRFVRVQTLWSTCFICKFVWRFHFGLFFRLLKSIPFRNFWSITSLRIERATWERTSWGHCLWFWYGVRVQTVTNRIFRRKLKLESQVYKILCRMIDCLKTTNLNRDLKRWYSTSMKGLVWQQDFCITLGSLNSEVVCPTPKSQRNIENYLTLEWVIVPNQR